jgi:hypothetical protein
MVKYTKPKLPANKKKTKPLEEMRAEPTGSKFNYAKKVLAEMKLKTAVGAAIAVYPTGIGQAAFVYYRFIEGLSNEEAANETYSAMIAMTEGILSVFSLDDILGTPKGSSSAVMSFSRNVEDLRIGELKSFMKKALQDPEFRKSLRLASAGLTKKLATGQEITDKDITEHAYSIGKQAAKSVHAASSTMSAKDRKSEESARSQDAE